MATRKQLLDQNDNEILPITDTESVRNPQSIGGTLESRLATVENMANNALHPLSVGQYTENNFVSFDANGGIKDSNCNEGTFIKGVQQNGVDLQKDEYGKVNVTVQDGEDGLSAFEIAQQQGYTGTVDQWLASLKANIGAFQFITPTDTTAEAALTTIGSTYSNAIGGVPPTPETLEGIILLMNDSNNTKTMMIATQYTQNGGFEFVYAGDLQSAMPSNVVTTDKIDNSFAGGSSNVAGAVEVKDLNLQLNGGDNTIVSEELVGEGKPIGTYPSSSQYGYFEYKDNDSTMVGWNRKSCFILNLAQYPGASKIEITGNIFKTGNQVSSVLFLKKDISETAPVSVDTTYSLQDLINEDAIPEGSTLSDVIKALSSGETTEIDIPEWANFVYVAYKYMGNNNIRTPQSFKIVYKEYVSGLQDKVNALQQDIDDVNGEISTINDRIDELSPISKPNQLHISFTPETSSYILSPFNETNYIKLYFVLKRNVSPTHNQSFNFSSVKLVNKSTSVETDVHTCGDDICPSNFNGTYLGGNHGNANIRKLTISGHGLNYSNIGEVWTYSTNGQATILGIIDNNNILAVSKNYATYPKFSYSDIPVNTVLSRNGASMTVEASESYQWFSSTNTPSVDVLCDGKLITEDGDYYFDTLKICESYDIMNTEDQISEIRSNAGNYTATPNPASLESTVKTARHSIIYQFKSAKDWIIATTFTAYQDITFSRFGFTQQMTLRSNNNMDLHLYIPKTLPAQDEGSTTFDFRTCPSYTSHSGIIWLTESKWENAELPPDRWFEYNNAIGLHSGFLFDYGVGGNNRKNCINSAFYLPASNKIYINGIDQKITVNAGDSYSGVVWRTYLDRSKVMTNGVISVNEVEYDNKLYIYADYNAVGIYEITIPDSYLGKTIEVFEKSDNITLLTPISNRKVLVKVETANPLYGYIVVQIKK